MFPRYSMTLAHCLLSTALLTISAWCGEAEDFLAKSEERFKGAKEWSLDFQVELRMDKATETSGYKGSLLIGANDRFRLDVPGQTIASDGMTLWQFSKAQKQVMVKNVADMEGGMHPSEVLFRYLRCKPLAIEAKQLQGVQVHVIKLDPTGQVKGFRSMEVWLKDSDQTPAKLVTVDLGGTTATYLITNLRKNPSVQESDFRFVAPAGVEEIDMR